MTTRNDTTTRSTWESRVAEYRRLNALHAVHPFGRTKPSDPTYPAQEADEAALRKQVGAALEAVIHTPAPDGEALAEKLEIIAAEFLEDTYSADDPMAAATADGRRMGRKPAPDADADLLAAFAIYVSAEEAFEAGGELDNDACPLQTAFRAAVRDMDAAPMPTTLAGAAAWLRFGLVSNTRHREAQRIALVGTVAERAEYCRANWPTLCDEVRPYWAALVAIEAMGAQS